MSFQSTPVAEATDVNAVDERRIGVPGPLVEFGPRASAFSAARIGLCAARANLVPGLIMQAAMVVLVVAYYRSPLVGTMLSTLGEWKVQGGILGAMALGMLSGAILPELFLVLILQRGRWTRQNWRNLRFALPFRGYIGVQSDLLYRGLGLLIGTAATPTVVMKKVLIDQFIFTPLWSIPMCVFALQWYNGTLQKNGWPNLVRWYWRIWPASQLACWVYWLPMCSILYSMPGPLQLLVALLASSFWVMMFNYINATRTHESGL